MQVFTAYLSLDLSILLLFLSCLQASPARVVSITLMTVFSMRVRMEAAAWMA